MVPHTTQSRTEICIGLSDRLCQLMLKTRQVGPDSTGRFHAYDIAWLAEGSGGGWAVRGRVQCLLQGCHVTSRSKVA